MRDVVLMGPSHVTRWADEIAKGRLPNLPGVRLWGEGGLALFSQRLRDNIARHMDQGRDVWLIVPDFRFGNGFFQDHHDFSKTGPYVNGYATINRTLITAERDEILYRNALNILDTYVQTYGSRIRFAFWCVAVREHQNRLAGRHVDAQGVYLHPHWNYQALRHRYSANTVDIWPMTQAFQQFTVDQQGHPSLLAMAFIYHAFRMNDGEAAYQLATTANTKAMNELFMVEGSEPVEADSVQTHDPSGAQAFEGRDGWLFLTGDTNRGMQQHRGEFVLGPLQLAAARDELIARATWTQARNMRYVSFVAPDKNCVYWDRLPDAVQPSASRPVIQILKVAGELGVPFVYPLEAMWASRQEGWETYDATDTHWNGLGALVGYQALMDEVDKLGLHVRRLKTADVVCTHPFRRGDLGIKMNPHRSAVVRIGTVINASAVEVFDNGIANRGRMRIFENADAGSISAVVFGDSFQVAWLPYLAESFRRLVFVHRGDIDHDLLLSEQPDLVIGESVERFLPDAGRGVDRLTSQELVRDKLRRMDQSERRQALALALAAVQKNPQVPEAHLHLGLVHLAVGQAKLAASAVSQALAIRPGWRAALRYLAVAQYESGQYELARELDQKLGGGQPVLSLPEPFSMDEAHALRAAELGGWSYPHHHLGQIYLRSRKLIEAARHQALAVELAEHSSETWYRWGQILSAQGAFDEAAKRFREASSRRVDDRASWSALGQACAAAGNWKEALEAHQAAVRLSPRQAELHAATGGAAMRLGDLDLAQSCFSEAIRLDPDNEVAHTQMGVVFRKRGLLSQAVESFDAAVRSNPKSRGAAYELANGLVSLGRIDDALKRLTSSLPHFPQDLELLLLLARVQTRLRAFDEALRILDQVLAHTPDSLQAQQQRQTVLRLQAQEKTPAGTTSLPMATASAADAASHATAF